MVIGPGSLTAIGVLQSMPPAYQYMLLASLTYLLTLQQSIHPQNISPSAVLQISYLQFAAMYHVVACDHESDHRSEKHTIAAHDRNKHGRSVDEPPRINNRAEERGDICATADRDEARPQRGDVEATAHRVPTDVDSELRGDEGRASEKHDSACGPGRGIILEEH